MKDYTNYNTFSMASIVVSDLILIFFALTFVFLAKTVISFFMEYPKLSENLKKATDILLQ